MALYLIKHDFAKSQPRWTIDMATAFGEQNEGVNVEATDAKAAVESFNAGLLAGRRFNPFYLSVKEVKA